MVNTKHALVDNWPVEVLDIDYKKIGEFNSFAAAAKKLFLKPQSISTYIFRGNKSGVQNPRKSKITGKQYRFKLKQV
jgi:hypothetical protein